MSPLNLYPWHNEQWQQLTLAREQNRLPHALLLTGITGLGKKQFALRWAQSLFCQAKNVACTTCQHCHLLSMDSHPDFLRLEPLESGQIIKIDQIRAMLPFVNETPLQANKRIVIINPAHAMNIFAANALLKILEEPPANVYIILISDQPARLPATILSRCQKIAFKPPSAREALTWLQTECPSYQQDFSLALHLSGGAPLKAKLMLEETTNSFFTLRQMFYQGLSKIANAESDPLKLAAELQEQDIKLLLRLLLTWLQDIVRYKLVGSETELMNIDCRPFFAKIATRYSIDALWQYIDQVKTLYSYTLASLNLNRQLMLEELFIRWRLHAAS